jgi:hypothetical protein
MYDFGVFDPYGQAARMGRLAWPQGPMEEHGSAIGQSCLETIRTTRGTAFQAVRAQAGKPVPRGHSDRLLTKLTRPTTTSLKGNPMNNTKKRAERVLVIYNILIISNLSFTGCQKTRSSGFPMGSGEPPTRSNEPPARSGAYPAGSNRLRCRLLDGFEAIWGQDTNGQAAACLVY